MDRVSSMCPVIVIPVIAGLIFTVEPEGICWVFPGWALSWAPSVVLLVLKLADNFQKTSLLFLLVVDDLSEALALLLKLGDSVFLLFYRFSIIFFHQFGVFFFSSLILDKNCIDLLQWFRVLLF